jgi:hypothetical protein
MDDMTVDQMINNLVNVILALPVPSRPAFIDEVFKTWRTDNIIAITIIKEFERRLVFAGVIELV